MSVRILTAALCAAAALLLALAFVCWLRERGLRPGRTFADFVWDRSWLGRLVVCAFLAAFTVVGSTKSPPRAPSPQRIRRYTLILKPCWESRRVRKN